MPRYRFDLFDWEYIEDEGDAEAPDDIAAMDVAEEILRRLRAQQPELKNRHCSILISNQYGEEICRMPLDIVR
jgi:hypothetical protein